MKVSSFYVRKGAYEKDGKAGLVNKKPCPNNVALRTPPTIEEKILHLRRNYHFAPRREALPCGRVRSRLAALKRQRGAELP
jgi:hypothetical protein